MTKWEYLLKQVSVETAFIGETLTGLNSVGQAGWEAVAWIPDHQMPARGWVLFKKPAGSN
jgi:hypothetical protein